jgi:hypothetical protein
VGNGNIDVGNKTPTRKSGQPTIEGLAGIDGSSGPGIEKQSSLKADREKISRAMSQQRGDSGRGNESAPQKLVQLVGCRDPNAHPESRVNPRPIPVRR